jgi:hypothetical protein
MISRSCRLGAHARCELYPVHCGCGCHAFPLVWRVRLIRPEWFGRRCRILVHGGRRGARLIEFEDGLRVVCPGAYLRRA